MKKHLLAFLFGVFLVIDLAAQTTTNPSVHSSFPETSKITKIELLADSTRVTVDYVKTESSWSQDWVRFDSSTFIRDRDSDTYFKIRRLGNGMILNQKYPTPDSIGTVYTFVLVFPKLPAGVENIDLIAEGGFSWEMVRISNPGTIGSGSTTMVSAVSPPAEESAERSAAITIDSRPDPDTAARGESVSTAATIELDIKGKLLRSVKPKYPRNARRAGVTGIVEVGVVISETGDVISAEALTGPAELRKAAEEAAMRAKFSPSYSGGAAVKVKAKILFAFKKN